MAAIAGITEDNIQAFFRAQVPGADGPLQFSLIAGGRSNLTYLVRSGAQKWVLRRPPLGHVLPTAHDMEREFRVQQALAGTRVPVPKPIALCTDISVNGAPFYVMEYRPGIVLGDELPATFASDEESRRRISHALIDTLVQLHAIDYRAVGLQDFGHPEGFLERQVRRWAQQWERSQTAELKEIDELIRRLRQALPTSPAPTIVHGDYRLGNVALDPHDPGHIIAIYDWEMATLGDPLADLGYALIYWVDPDDDRTAAASIGTASTFTAQPGFLRRAELVAAYGTQSGRDLEHIDFYQVLALYKLAIISEGIYARHLQGKTLGEGFAGMTRSATNLARRALAIADAAADPRLR